MWTLYILLCSDGSFYTGITKDIKKRFKKHVSGKGAKYTRSHKVLKVIYNEKLNTISEALKREREIKSWTRRKKMEMLKLEI